LKNSEAKSTTSKTDKFPSYKEALRTIMSLIDEDEEDSTSEDGG